MKEFRGRVAVVTGAASGIGRALARTFGEQGMKVALADVEAGALQQVAQELKDQGTESLPVVTDVSRADEVSALAERTLEAFGAVHVVCNNAGVFAGGPSWEAPLSDYEWILGVNVWGVIHGIRTFVPILLDQGEEGHVVNTASVAGLTTAPLAGAYSMSKHAVIGLSETLYMELTQSGSKVGVSVLCPEGVSTRIAEAERNRPPHLKRRPEEEEASPGRAVVEAAIRDAVARGIDPREIAERVLGAIRENRFYILPGGQWREAFETRLEDIRLGRNPTFAFPTEEG